MRKRTCSASRRRGENDGPDRMLQCKHAHLRIARRGHDGGKSAGWLCFCASIPPRIPLGLSQGGWVEKPVSTASLLSRDPHAAPLGAGQQLSALSFARKAEMRSRVIHSVERKWYGEGERETSSQKTRDDGFPSSDDDDEDERDRPPKRHYRRRRGGREGIIRGLVFLGLVHFLRRVRFRPPHPSAQFTYRQPRASPLHWRTHAHKSRKLRLQGDLSGMKIRREGRLFPDAPSPPH